MRIFDRYALRSFVRVWIIAFLCVAGLYVVIDLFANLDAFLSYSDQAGGIAAVAVPYYGARVAVFWERSSAVLVLMASLFVVARMHRTREIIAIEAAGISRWRIARPFLLAAVAVSCLAAVSREKLIPRLRDPLSRRPQDWFDASSKKLLPRYDNQTDIYLQGQAVNVAQSSIERPVFRLPSSLSHVGRAIAAERATFLRADAGHPSGYLMENVASPADLDQLPNQSLGDQIVLYTPRDTPWLRSKQCFVVTEVDVEQLVASDAWRRYASTAELIRALRNPSLDYGADVRVAVHQRILQPILDLLVILVGLPVAFLRRSTNVYWAIGQSVLFVAGYFGLLLLCQAMGNNYLIRPALAAWLPVIVLVPMATWSLTSAFWPR